MAKFRKRPIIVDAVQLRWDTWDEMCSHANVGHLENGQPEGVFGPDNSINLNIPTLEGLMVAREGDWVIKGVNGELYPCKPDIFDKTYEPNELPKLEEE